MHSTALFCRNQHDVRRGCVFDVAPTASWGEKSGRPQVGFACPMLGKKWKILFCIPNGGEWWWWFPWYNVTNPQPSWVLKEMPWLKIHRLTSKTYHNTLKPCWRDKGTIGWDCWPRFSHPGVAQKWRKHIQGGPLLVISGVITPINGRK